MKELECARKEIMQVFKAMSDIATHNVSDTEKTNTALGAMTADFKNIEQSTEVCEQWQMRWQTIFRIFRCN